MGHQKHNLSMQVTLALKDKIAFGESKHLAKQDGTAKDKIFSFTTYETYKKHGTYFVEYCKAEHGCKTLDQCRQFAPEWLEAQKGKGLSPFTLKLEASALGKLYGCGSASFGVEMPACSRSGITRSRGTAVRDSHFSEAKNADLVDFCKGTGLRRSELTELKGSQLVRSEDGNYYIHVIGKGGRERHALVIGNVEKIVSMMQAAGDSKVFPRGIHNGCDVHGYRADYATAIYEMYARPLEVCKSKPFYNPSRHAYDKDSVYHMRGDFKGRWLDKGAMLIASRYLGHNRITVVGAHYIR